MRYYSLVARKSRHRDGEVKAPSRLLFARDASQSIFRKQAGEK